MNDFWETRTTRTQSLPRRPRPPRRRRERFAGFGFPSMRWTRFTIGAVALATLGVMALGFAVLDPDATAADGPSAAGASPAPGERREQSARSVAIKRPTDPYFTHSWRRDLAPDPTEMLVTRADTFVVTTASVVSYATRDGKPRWVSEVKDPEPYLAVNANTVLVAVTDGFAALERSTGGERWRLTLDDPTDRSRTVALVRTESGPVAVVTTDRGGVVGIDAQTGDTLWSITVDGRPRGRLAAANDHGLVTVFHAREGHSDLRVIDAATGTVRWSRTMAPGTGTPIVVGDRLVIGWGAFDDEGTLAVLAVRDGRTIWEAEIQTSFEAGEEPTVAGDVLYVVDRSGMIEARTFGTGALLWQYEMQGFVLFGRPVVIGQYVVLHDMFADIYFLDRQTGRLRLRGQSIGVPVHYGAAGGRLVIAQSQRDHGQVAAYAPKVPASEVADQTTP